MVEVKMGMCNEYQTKEREDEEMVGESEKPRHKASNRGLKPLRKEHERIDR